MLNYTWEEKTMMVSEEKFRNKFCNTEMRTLKFFLLSLISMNFWMYF